MPLVGVVDPSHKQMARDTMGVLPPWLTLDEALEASADPKWAPWTQVMLRAMFDQHQERDYISTSSLVAHCPRALVLQRRFPYVGDLASMYVPFRGTSVHALMERYAGPDDIAEARFWTEVDGVEISCSPDLITAQGQLLDYKFTENPPLYNSPWRSHTEQVQINAFIVRNATRNTLGDKMRKPFVPDVTSLGLVYMGPKAPKVLAVETTASTVDPATGKLHKAKVPSVWSDESVLAMIRPRLSALVEALHAPYVVKDAPENTLQEPHLWRDLTGISIAMPLSAALWGGNPDSYACPGAPLCRLPDCLAKRYPDRLIWPKGGGA